MAEIKQEPISQKKLAYIRRERTKEMRQQMVSFGLMIFLTFVAFGLVAMDLDASFVIPIVVAMAFLQVILQFYYFMHIKDKVHDYIKLILLSVMFCALAFLTSFTYIVLIGTPSE